MSKARTLNNYKWEPIPLTRSWASYWGAFTGKIPLEVKWFMGWPKSADEPIVVMSLWGKFSVHWFRAQLQTCTHHCKPFFILQTELCPHKSFQPPVLFFLLGPKRAHASRKMTSYPRIEPWFFFPITSKGSLESGLYNGKHLKFLYSL